VTLTSLRRDFGRTGRVLRQRNFEVLFEHAAFRILGPERSERWMFRRKAGYDLDLDDPRTFNQKIAWRKLRQVIPFAPLVSDKLAVRDLVARRAGDRYLNDLIAVYDRAEDIDFARLPGAFAAKCTHGSKFNVFVTDKASTDLDAVRRRLAAYMAIHDYGRVKNEWWYSRITPRIIIEPLLVDGDLPAPVDFQAHVYDGRVAFFLLLHGRLDIRRLRYYDRDWHPLDLYHGPLAELRPRPKHLDEMIDVAEALGRDMDFVRVDLYYPSDGAVLFGEFTLAPASGRLRFNLQSTDEWMGSLWRQRPYLDLRP
jgi:hypothetical protein